MSAQAVPPPPEPVHALDFTPLEALVARAFPGGGAPAYEPMPGGASTRRYFRVTLARGGTAVAMFVPDGAKPEEIAQGAPAASRWPFLELRELLDARAIDVPVLHGEDTSRGWVLLEDLGDDERASINEAVKTVRRHRAVAIGMPRVRRVGAELRPERHQ